jgi:hypothetical protein
LTRLGLTYFEEKKLIEERRALLKQRRIDGIKEEIKQFKDTKQIMAEELTKEKVFIKDQKKGDVSKIKDIKQLIKGEQKLELQWNLGVFKQLNNEEKELRTELLSK